MDEKKLKNFHSTGNCPVRDILCRFGDKWSVLVLITLQANGTMRFNEIQKTIDDISQRMLSVTLRTLEQDGLIRRKVYAEVPHINALVDWAMQNMSRILEKRK